MSDPARLILKAVEYGFPAFETARLSYNFTYNPKNPRRMPVNRFAHRRTLADHTHRILTTPNNDTLYSSAVIDLSEGPLHLTVPDFGRRYYSIAFMDAYTNNFAYIGTRATGEAGGTYLIAGPNWQGDVPPNVKMIRAPGDHINAHVRILVDGISDTDEIHRLQDGLILSGPAPARAGLIPPLAGDPANFIAVVNQVLHADPPPAQDAPILEELISAGIGSATLTEEQQSWWSFHFAAARAELIAASKMIGPVIAGWQYLPPHVGDFGTDYATRAKIMIRGAGANIAAESVYTIALADGVGRNLDGAHRYRFRLPAGAPPVDGFWSLSIYEMMRDGAMYFGDNALHRYAIGNRTQNLVRNSDGGLGIFIQKEMPATGTANWLPVPARNFALILRAYLPRPDLIDGFFRYDGIERLD